MTTLFTYNQEQAIQTGGGQWVLESGGYDLKIIRASFTKSQSANSRAEFLELDVETREGAKCNYISICYTKGDGTSLDFGHNAIQSLMGCSGAQALTVDNNGNCPDLINKTFKGILQRVDYSKNNGQDGFKFELKLCANVQTGQTMKEHVEQKQAAAFAEYASSVTNKDERKSQSSVGQSGGCSQQQSQQVSSSGYNAPTPDFSDDIPF